MQQSDIPMTPHRDEKKPKKQILFYFVLPAKKLVRESQKTLERQNAVLSLVFEIGGSYINIHIDIYIHTHIER